MYCAVSGCVQLYECICVFMHDGLSRVFASKSKLARSPKEIEDRCCGRGGGWLLAHEKIMNFKAWQSIILWLKRNRYYRGVYVGRLSSQTFASPCVLGRSLHMSMCESMWFCLSTIKIEHVKVHMLLLCGEHVGGGTKVGDVGSWTISVGNVGSA